MDKRKNNHDLDCKKCNNGKVTVTSKLMKDHVLTTVSKCSNCKYQYGLNEILKANGINMFGDPKLLSDGVEPIPEDPICKHCDTDIIDWHKPYCSRRQTISLDMPIPVEGEGVKRKVGTYWIKLHTGWTAAHFNGECFWYGNSPILAQKVYDIIESRIPSPDDEQGVSFPNKLHSDTEQLLKNTSNILREKLIKNQQKYGYSNEWLLDDWEDECRQHMMQHIQKGDPKDVIIYAMFMLFHGWSTAFSPPSANDGREGREEIDEEQKDIVRSRVDNYIRQSGYQWSTDEIFEQYELYKDGAYVSHTAKDVILNAIEYDNPILPKKQFDFKSAMKNTFEHGRANFSMEQGADWDMDSPDDKLSFNDWFKKHYSELPTERSKAEQWISVEDRLPTDYNRFLCLRMNDQRQCYIEDVCLFDSPSKKWIFQRDYVKVSHWMELPQAPTQQRQNNLK